MAQPSKQVSEGDQRPDPQEELVKIFESEEETEALVVKGLLESAGIDSDVAPRALSQNAFPNMGGTIILVREEDAENARRLIAEYKQSPDVDEEAEPSSTEEPPAKL